MASERSKLAPVHILVSEQPILLSREFDALLDAALPPAARGFNYDVMDGKGLSADRVLTAAQTLPMMARRRMVWVRDIAAMAGAELARLIPYLDAPSPTTVLVGTASKVDKRIKFFAQARKKKYLRELEAPRQVGPWLKDEARQRGVAIEPAAVARLADVVGKDLSRLSLALEQLELYAGDRTVTVADVDDLIATTRERSVFELADAIGAGELPAALASVASLCEQRQSAVGVVMILARHMRQLGLCHAAMAERLPKAALARRVGVPPFLAGKLMGQARRYPPAAVARAIALLSHADRELKGQTQVVKTLGRQLGDRIVLDRLVGQLVALGRG